MGASLVLGAGAAVLPFGPVAGPPGSTAGVAYGAERTPPGIAAPRSGAPRSDADDPRNAPPPSDADDLRNAEPVSRSPSVSPSASPSASRAGSGPGEGRERPGRQETASEEARDTAPPRRGRETEEDEGARDAAGRPDGDEAR
ncbi:hypothetical protein, partial [Streptomyces sp. RO-S4]